MNFPEIPRQETVPTQQNYSSILSPRFGLPGGNKVPFKTVSSQDKYLPNLVDITEPPQQIYRGEKKSKQPKAQDYANIIDVIKTIPKSRVYPTKKPKITKKSTMLSKERNTTKMNFKSEI